MSQYFIKRGEKIHGPFSTKQVNSGLESGKLKDADLISESKSGPWQTVTEQFQEPAPVVEVISEDLPTGEGSLFDSMEIPATVTTFQPTHSPTAPVVKQVPTSHHALEAAENEIKESNNKLKKEKDSQAASARLMMIGAIAAAAFLIPGAWLAGSGFFNYMYQNEGAYPTKSTGNSQSLGSNRGVSRPSRPAKALLGHWKLNNIDLYISSGRAGFVFEKLYANGSLDTDPGSYETFRENIKEGTIKLRYVDSDDKKSRSLLPTITFSPDRKSWTSDSQLYPGTILWVDEKTSY